MRRDRAKAYAEEKGLPVREAHGLLHIVLPREGLKAHMAAFKAMGFNYLADVIGIDYRDYPGGGGEHPERFAVVYELVSIPGYKDGDGSRIYPRVYVPEKKPEVETVSDLWPSANFPEREVYDLFGIVFAGHPDLRRILMPEDFEGHPLRKDFPLGETPTLFNEGRYIDPESFRAGLRGREKGLTGWRGGRRKGERR
jgi:NADH-quinone oxidoreductase subunit C